MSSKKKYFLINNQFYYNNVMSKNYSLFFFQLKLIKNFFFFFFNSLTSLYGMNQKKYIYVTQFYINSIKNNLIISVSLWKDEIKKKDFSKFDNYFRLKYFFNFFKSKNLFICYL